MRSISFDIRCFQGTPLYGQVSYCQFHRLFQLYLFEFFKIKDPHRFRVICSNCFFPWKIPYVIICCNFEILDLFVVFFILFSLHLSRKKFDFPSFYSKRKSHTLIVKKTVHKIDIGSFWKKKQWQKTLLPFVCLSE